MCGLFSSLVSLFFASRRRHTRGALVTGVQTCALPISPELLAAGRAEWQARRSDPAARFDREIALDAGDIPPMVSWGTSPDQSLAITAAVPGPEDPPADRRAVPTIGRAERRATACPNA